MGTLAQLKRDAKTGTIEAKLVYRFGAEIPDRLQGWRRLIDSNTVGVTFLNANGRESELRISSANLIDYNENSLVLYGTGLRDLTDEERAVMREWEAIQAELPIWDSGYWKKLDFFKKRDMEWLLGYEFVRGKKYDYNTGKVYDRQVRGAVEIAYELRHNK